MSECGTVRGGDAIESAGGVFAPGHLGALTSLVPVELVDAVLQATGRVQRRLRLLPSRVGVYLVLAMVLFPQVGLAGVWSRLTAGLVGPVAGVSEKALRDLRRRIGPEPIEQLFQVVAGPAGWPGMPGVRYRRWRTVAFDGCSSFKVPDTERNRRRFPKVAQPHGLPAYPMLMLMALVETGTRALIAATFGPTSTGEIAYATTLLPKLGSGDLLLIDRGFDAKMFLAAVVDTGAAFLVRARACRILTPAALLPDGSYLTQVGEMTLRVVTACIQVTCADGTVTTTEYRLLTTLTNHHTDPADVLVRLYHERWEVETAFLSLRHALAGRSVLRSGDPVGIAQEMWALLTVYQILRTVMADAMAVAGADPDRAGFTVALGAARDSLIIAEPPETGLIGRIGACVLAHRLPPRRARRAPRAVKCSTPRYRRISAADRDRRGTAITGIDITVIDPPPPPQLPKLHPLALPEHLPALQTTARPDLIHALAIMHANPDRPHRAMDLGRLLGLTTRDELNAFGVAMNKQAKHGRIHKIRPGTYTIIRPPLTADPNP